MAAAWAAAWDAARAVACDAASAAARDAARAVARDAARDAANAAARDAARDAEQQWQMNRIIEVLAVSDTPERRFKMDAGKINKDWYEGARQNVNDVLEIDGWFESQTNHHCDIQPDLTVWRGDRWLTQPEINNICAKIDADYSHGSL